MVVCFTSMAGQTRVGLLLDVYATRAVLWLEIGLLNCFMCSVDYHPGFGAPILALRSYSTLGIGKR